MTASLEVKARNLEGNRLDAHTAVSRGWANIPTFLMTDVEVVAMYGLYNINRVKLGVGEQWKRCAIGKGGILNHLADPNLFVL